MQREYMQQKGIKLKLYQVRAARGPCYLRFLAAPLDYNS